MIEPDARETCWAPLLEDVLCGLDETAQWQWVGEAVLCACEMMCDFSRRFLFPRRVYPLLLVWMLREPHDVPCVNR